MDLREAIYTRRAVRAYIQEPLDRELIGGLIDAAIQAPSAVNEQAWSFCVVQDQQLLARISEASKAHMLAHHQGVESRMRQMLKNPDFNIFYHAPALILISSTHRGRWAVENCALAAQNLMLAARGAGLGPAGSVSPRTGWIRPRAMRRSTFRKSGCQSRRLSWAIRSSSRWRFPAGRRTPAGS